MTPVESFIHSENIKNFKKRLEAPPTTLSGGPSASTSKMVRSWHFSDIEPARFDIRCRAVVGHQRMAGYGAD
jgi:hypothetical protein